MNKEQFKIKCAEILRDNITLSPQTQNYVIHGALEELWKIYSQNQLAITEVENAMERWHFARDNDDETLQKINDILVGINKLQWFNEK